MFSALVSIASLLIPALSAGLPQILGYMKSKTELEQQIKLAELQLEAAKQNIDMQLNIEEMKQQVEMLKLDNQDNENGFIKFIKGSIRPTVTYILFMFYISIKVAFFMKLMAQPGAEVINSIVLLWNQFDENLLMCVISFWFGGRIASKWVQGSSLMSISKKK